MGRIKLIHYHTDTKDAAPNAANLELGEIAVNTNTQSVQIYFKDSSENIHRFTPNDYAYSFVDTDFDGTLGYKVLFSWDFSNAYSRTYLTFQFASYLATGNVSMFALSNNNSSNIMSFYLDIFGSLGLANNSSVNNLFFLYYNNITHILYLLFGFSQKNNYIHLSNVLSGGYNTAILDKSDDWFGTIDEKIYGKLICKNTFNNAKTAESAVEAAQVKGTLSLAGTSFNGSSNVTIDKLDCGEF